MNEKFSNKLKNEKFIYRFRIWLNPDSNFYEL